VRLLGRAFVRWLPLAVAVSMLSVVVYGVAQQTYRQGANDPQIQMAEDAARAVAAGASPGQVVGSATVDPSVSLAPFLIVTDASGNAVASGARIGGSSPVPPKGVLDAAASSGENRVTWQPRRDVRIASVEVPVDGGRSGFVVAGRSLRVVEEREDALTPMVGAGWLGTLAVTFAVVFLLGRVKEHAKQPTAKA
jgi:hypothetical protein